MQHGLLKKLWFIGLLATGITAAAQQDSMRYLKSSHKPLFQSITTAGLVAGASGSDLLLQTIAGVQYKHVFAGAGGGIDYYYRRTVPVFIDLRKTFSKAHAFFTYADIGMNLPWIKNELVPGMWYTSDFKKGLYYDIGAGWNFKIVRRNAVALSVGYCEKNFAEIQKASPMPVGADEKLYTTKINYNLRRIVFKLGVQL